MEVAPARSLGGSLGWDDHVAVMINRGFDNRSIISLHSHELQCMTDAPRPDSLVGGRLAGFATVQGIDLSSGTTARRSGIALKFRGRSARCKRHHHPAQSNPREVQSLVH